MLPHMTAICAQASDGEESTQMARDESTRLQCRFYEEQYPNPESMVMVKVINIADMAAEVILLEYNDIEVRTEKRKREGTGCRGG
jgi:translation initiation factor 2 subunit 1